MGPDWTPMAPEGIQEIYRHFNKADCAHVGAVYGNGSRVCKNPSRNSKAIDGQRLVIAQ